MQDLGRAALLAALGLVLYAALVGVDRRVEEDERERRAHEGDRSNGQSRERDMAEPEKHETAGMIAEPTTSAGG